MRLKSVILLLVAVLVAGTTALLVRGWVNAERARLASSMPQAVPAPPPPPLPRVLVAKVDLPVGQFVRPDDLTWQPWPEAAVQPVYIVEGKRPMDDFVGAVVRSRTTAGEPIIDGRLISPRNSGFLAAVLPPGLRAVTLPVNANSAVSGFIYPGDRVDLLLTMTVEVTIADGGKQDRKATETVLTDLRVLAVDQRLDAKPGESMLGSRVTFEVTPKQSEILAVVATMGHLSIALRSLGTTEEESAALAAAGETPAEGLPSRGGVTLDSEASRVITPWGGRANQRRIAIVRGDKVDERAVEGSKK